MSTKAENLPSLQEFKDLDARREEIIRKHHDNIVAILKESGYEVSETRVLRFTNNYVRVEVKL